MCGHPRQVERFLDHIGALYRASKPGETWMEVVTTAGVRIGQIDPVREGQWGFSALNAALAPMLDRACIESIRALDAPVSPPGWDSV